MEHSLFLKALLTDFTLAQQNGELTFLFLFSAFVTVPWGKVAGIIWSSRPIRHSNMWLIWDVAAHRGCDFSLQCISLQWEQQCFI